MLIHHGMNRRDLDREFKQLGGSVTLLPGTGDIQYTHPALSQRPKANSRRKDAPRHLVGFVQHVQQIKRMGSNFNSRSSSGKNAKRTYARPQCGIDPKYNRSTGNVSRRKRF